MHACLRMFNGTHRSVTTHMNESQQKKWMSHNNKKNESQHTWMRKWMRMHASLLMFKSQYRTKVSSSCFLTQASPPICMHAWHDRFTCDMTHSWLIHVCCYSFICAMTWLSSSFFLTLTSAPICMHACIHISVDFLWGGDTGHWWSSLKERNALHLICALLPIISALHPTQSALYAMRRAVYLIKRAQYSIKRVLYPVKRVLYFIKRALSAVKRALCAMKRALGAGKRALYAAKRATYAVKRALYFVKRDLYAIKRALYAVKRALCAVTRALYATKRIVYAITHGAKILDALFHVTRLFCMTRLVHACELLCLYVCHECCDFFTCMVCLRDTGWLRLVGSIKVQVSFAKETYKEDYIL